MFGHMLLGLTKLIFFSFFGAVILTHRRKTLAGLLSWIAVLVSAGPLLVT